MRIVVWNSPDDGSVARIEVPAATLKKGSARVQWLPVAIHGEDEADAAGKAKAFYDGELERFARQSESKEARLEKMKAARLSKKEPTQ